ncbi:MAG: hypothetical protein ACRDSR_14620 [Pseudonocardiaceae bacterium]
MPHPTTSPLQRSNPAYQTSHGLLQAVVRDALLDVVGSTHGLQGIGRVGFGACAGLGRLQTPVVSPTPRFQAGRPELDHGGAQETPERPLPRRGPSGDPLPGPGRSLLLTGAMTWPS